MSEYLLSRNVQCDDCFKCLHECMVKAIAVKDREARILEDRCILCGHCTMVCPQNAKVVVSERDKILQLIASGKRVIASVAPSFVSNTVAPRSTSTAKSFVGTRLNSAGTATGRPSSWPTGWAAG